MRKLLLLAALGLAVGIPYWYSHHSGSGSTASPEFGVRSQPPSKPGDPAAPPQPQVTGPEVSRLDELFHFDIGKPWILGNWSMVSTAPGDGDLRGYRVPLVTGTEEESLVGALTYYFDNRHLLQRIVFVGSTGDARPLVRFMRDKYRLEPQYDGKPGAYLFEIRGKYETISSLEIKPARVVSSDIPTQRFDVKLKLERPKWWPKRRQARR